jgi:hypothetical protein
MKLPRRQCRRGVVFMVSWWWSLCRDLGDGGSGAGFVDDRFVGCEGGDEGLDRQVVHRPGQAAGDLVDQSDRVVAEQCVGAAGQLEVMRQVALGQRA